MTTPTSSKARRALVAAVVAAATLVSFGVLGGVGLAKTAIGVAQYQYGGKVKVTLCHKQKNTITVGAPAVPAHRRHGDTLGTCAAAQAQQAKAAKVKAAKVKAAKAKAAAQAAKAKADKAKADKAKGTPKQEATTSAAQNPGDKGKGHEKDKGSNGNGKGKGK